MYKQMTLIKQKRLLETLTLLILDRIGLGRWVLWHINLCRLFNAKSIFM